MILCMVYMYLKLPDYRVSSINQFGMPLGKGSLGTKQPRSQGLSSSLPSPASRKGKRETLGTRLGTKYFSRTYLTNAILRSLELEGIKRCLKCGIKYQERSCLCHYDTLFLSRIFSSSIDLVHKGKLASSQLQIGTCQITVFPWEKIEGSILQDYRKRVRRKGGIQTVPICLLSQSVYRKGF